jgi:hypothetical protein
MPHDVTIYLTYILLEKVHYYDILNLFRKFLKIASIVFVNLNFGFKFSAQYVTALPAGKELIFTRQNHMTCYNQCPYPIICPSVHNLYTLPSFEAFKVLSQELSFTSTV